MSIPVKIASDVKLLEARAPRTTAGRGMRLPASMQRPPERGRCRWCDDPIVKEDGTPDLRRTWHPACAKWYEIATVPRAARRALRKRDGKACSRCGTPVNSSDHPWEAHHVVPLWRADGDPKLYGIDNQVILCVEPCHRFVSALDAAERRAHRAAQHNALPSDLAPRHE